MPNLFFQATGFVSQRNLPVLSNIDDIIYVEQYEMDAFGHWIFDDKNPLLSKSNAATLTVQTGATIAPEYAASYVKLSAGMGNALMTSLQDTAGTFTLVALIQPESTSLLNVMGTLGANTPTPVTGAGIFTSANKVCSTVRGGTASLDTQLTLDPSKPVLVAFSVDNVAKTISMLTSQNGVIQTATGVISAYAPSTASIGIGNSRYSTSAAFDPLKTKFYEAIVYNKSLTMAQLQAVAARSKKRMQNRGITF